MRKKFKKYGIDEAYLSEILGRKVVDFGVEEVKKGARLRADLYRFKIKYEDGEGVVFVKDLWYGSSMSGEVVKSTLSENREILGENEKNFLIFGTRNGAFTPRYFGHKEYANDKTGKHTVLIMENFDMSLEEKLLELKKEMNDSNDEKKKQLEDLAYDYLRRTVDIALVNNYLASQSYPTHDPVESRIVYKLDEEMLTREITRYLNAIITFKFKREKSEDTIREFLNWDRDYDYPGIFSTLVDLIAKPLSRDIEKRGLVNLDLYPSNILLRNTSLPPYDPDAILELREGRKGTNLYDGLAITDNNALGIGSFAMTGTLAYHPSVFLTKNTQKKIAEHILIQQKKLEEGKEVHLEDIDPEERLRYNWEYAAIMRLTCLKNVNFAVWLKLLYPEKAKALEEQAAFYEPIQFIRENVGRFTSLNDILTEQCTEQCERINRGLEALKP